MPMRVMVNGREVNNPAVRAVAMMVVMAVVALLMTLLMFVALPLLGVAVGTVLGLAAVGAGSLLVGLPLAIRRGLRARGVVGDGGRGVRRDGVRDLPGRAWAEAEEADYTIEDIPPSSDSESTTDNNPNKDQ